MKLKTIIGETAFWIHVPILIGIYGLFLVPTSLWLNKITFHFWYLVIIFLIQIIWGTFMFQYTKKIDIVCPLTTLTQYFRGHKISSKKNYNHSFTAEFFKRFKINLSYQLVNITILLALIFVSIQFFVFT